MFDEIEEETSRKPVRSRAALTPEGREQQLIALAYDLVEERLRNGTATSQETTHFLKLGTEKARAELEVLKMQKELMAAKKENLESQKVEQQLYIDAIEAMRRYSGSLRRTNEDVQ